MANPSAEAGLVDAVAMAVCTHCHLGVAVVVVLFHTDQTHHRAEYHDGTLTLLDHLLAYHLQQVQGSRGVNLYVCFQSFLILGPAYTAVTLGNDTAAVNKDIQRAGIFHHKLNHLLNAFNIALVESNRLDLDALFLAQVFAEVLCRLYRMAGNIDIGTGICQSQSSTLAVHCAAAGNENILSLQGEQIKSIHYISSLTLRYSRRQQAGSHR